MTCDTCLEPMDPKRGMDDPVNIDLDFDEALAALLDDDEDEGGKPEDR